MFIVNFRQWFVFGRGILLAHLIDQRQCWALAEPGPRSIHSDRSRLCAASESSDEVYFYLFWEDHEIRLQKCASGNLPRDRGFQKLPLNDRFWLIVLGEPS